MRVHELAKELGINSKQVIDHQLPSYQIQGEKMNKYSLQDKSILENKFFGIVEIPIVDQQIMQYTKAKYKIYFYNKLAEA